MQCHSLRATAAVLCARSCPCGSPHFRSIAAGAQSTQPSPVPRRSHCFSYIPDFAADHHQQVPEARARPYLLLVRSSNCVASDEGSRQRCSTTAIAAPVPWPLTTLLCSSGL
eukprot:363983-Chlamydomonas_euryale.AAC.1